MTFKAIFAFCLLLIFGSAYFSFKTVSHASTPNPVPIVTTESAKMTDLFDSLSYPARIESKVDSKILAESEGVVTKILAPLGSHVRRGSRIAIIKHTDPVYQYAPMVLTSPVAGIVSQVDVTEGSTIAKGDLLAEVTDPNQIRAVIELAAGDISTFKPGMMGELTLTGEDSKIFFVKVIGYSPVVDPATGTATCELEIIKPVSIPPGAVGQAQFKINHRKAFVFPDNAVMYRGNDTYVRLVQNGVAKKIAVVLGKKERGQVEILKGLKEGDVVIERASSFIGDGEKVTVEN